MFADLPPAVVLALFAGFAVVIALVGVRMTDYADRIADRTGLGEAIVGGVILGAATSLSGTIVSISAAMEGRASLAFSTRSGALPRRPPSWRWPT